MADKTLELLSLLAAEKLNTSPAKSSTSNDTKPRESHAADKSHQSGIIHSGHSHGEKSVSFHIDKVDAHTPMKALPIIEAAEIGRVIDLGLGRGVDATDPSPWTNKSSFQVRSVSMENILGTEEGGSLQSYENEICSVSIQQSNLKASVAIPNSPVTLGLESELSRSSSTSRKAIGKKVINRTISFRADFADAPEISGDSDSEKESGDTKTSARKISVVAKASKILSKQTKLTFEERLSGWILARVYHRHEARRQTSRESDTNSILAWNNPIDDLMQHIRKSSEEETKAILEDCADFVQHFRITHYVSSISLGASQYRVLSESEYFNKVSAGGTFGFEAIANASQKSTFSKKTKKKSSNLRQIGKLKDDKVERGSYDEAVVEIKIQPIQSLVHMRFLHLALRKALLDYIDQRGDNSCGPFLIGCGDEKLYWKVNTSQAYAVEATSDITQASMFFIVPHDDGKLAYEYNIGWQGDNRRQLRRASSSLSPAPSGQLLMRYLEANSNLFGINNGPLKMRSDLDSQNSRLTLRRRLVGKKGKTPVDTSNWINGKEAYFIHCAGRKGIDGYIAVSRVQQAPNSQQKISYITKCVSNQKKNDELNCWMLFRLLPCSLRDTTHGSSDTPGQGKAPEEVKIDQEFETYLNNFKSPQVTSPDHTIPHKTYNKYTPREESQKHSVERERLTESLDAIPGSPVAASLPSVIVVSEITPGAE